ncbi:MAG: hypothetical protein U1F42_04865 [Candidatus Competibacteraceae bacterium]
MADEGIQDFRSAKRKAAARLNVANKALLPDNTEIEQALLDYQRLFRVDLPDQLRALRETALDAMRFLTRFRPRLVGSVLTGTACPHSDISLHLFADVPEEVALFLMEHNRPFETSERRLRLSNGEHACFPVFRFEAGERCINLTVFQPLAEREAPRSPVDSRPMRRASVIEVQALLATESVPQR